MQKREMDKHFETAEVIVGEVAIGEIHEKYRRVQNVHLIETGLIERDEDVEKWREKPGGRGAEEVAGKGQLRGVENREHDFVLAGAVVRRREVNGAIEIDVELLGHLIEGGVNWASGKFNATLDTGDGSGDRGKREDVREIRWKGPLEDLGEEERAEAKEEKEFGIEAANRAREVA
jgi:hypothetical protein